MTPGWHLIGAFGNLHRVKDYIRYNVNHLDANKRIFHLLHPNHKLMETPYFAFQMVTEYHLNRQRYTSVTTTVIPLTTSLSKLYEGTDYLMTQASFSKSFLAGLRMKDLNVVRTEQIKVLSGIWKAAKDHFKKDIPSGIMNMVMGCLGILKSAHCSLDLLNDTPNLDHLIAERVILQSCGPTDITSYFSPYLFRISTMDETMCLEENFIYPDMCDLKFSSISEGLFLLDNGRALYIFIAKKHDSYQVKKLFGK